MLSLTQEMMDHAGTNEGYFPNKEKNELKTVNGQEQRRYDAIRYDTIHPKFCPKVFSLPSI